jgi:hypothetical protein
VWASGGLQKPTGVWILPHTVWLAGWTRSHREDPRSHLRRDRGLCGSRVILWRHHLWGGVRKEQLEVFYCTRQQHCHRTSFIYFPIGTFTILTLVSLLHPIRQLFLGDVFQEVAKMPTPLDNALKSKVSSPSQPRSCSLQYANVQNRALFSVRQLTKCARNSPLANT